MGACPGLSGLKSGLSGLSGTDHPLPFFFPPQLFSPLAFFPLSPTTPTRGYKVKREKELRCRGRAQSRPTIPRHPRHTPWAVIPKDLNGM